MVYLHKIVSVLVLKLIRFLDHAKYLHHPVCPLLNVDNGIFQRDAQALVIAKRVIAECLAIAYASGVMLDEAEVVDGLLSISKASDGQLISTLQDINNKRPTEIDTLNFEIVRIAERLSKGCLVSENRLLGELTAIKSQITTLSKMV